MAKYRYVHCEFWEDPDMLDYTPEEKFFYLYILTNPHTKQCGIYEISIKQMAFETGFNRDTIKKLIERFENEYEKIKFNSNTKELAIKNWLKYNYSTSPKVEKCIKKELKNVKDINMLDFIEDMDTLSIPYHKEKEKLKEKEKENKDTVSPPYQKIKKLYNDICKSLPSIRKVSDRRRDHIKARWREEKNIDIFKEVFTKTENSSFLTGDNDRNWKADFDWIVKNDTNFNKILEGRYDDKKNTSSGLRKITNEEVEEWLNE